MARAYIVDSTATQVSGPCKKVLITVNKTDAVSVKVIDGISGTTANVATIATLVVGNRHEYWNFTVGCLIIASNTCDITVCTDGSYGSP